jgi:hypothetical protein
MGRNGLRHLLRRPGRPDTSRRPPPSLTLVSAALRHAGDPARQDPVSRNRTYLEAAKVQLASSAGARKGKARRQAEVRRAGGRGGFRRDAVRRDADRLPEGKEDDRNQYRWRGASALVPAAHTFVVPSSPRHRYRLGYPPARRPAGRGKDPARRGRSAAPDGTRSGVGGRRGARVVAGRVCGRRDRRVFCAAARRRRRPDLRDRADDAVARDRGDWGGGRSSRRNVPAGTQPGRRHEDD